MKEYLLYGMGKSNLAVKKYFDQQRIKYTIYLDTMDLNKVKISKDLVVIKSPGIKSDTKLMQLLIDQQIAILTDIGLFYQLFKDVFYIGITGTLGKTTTTLLCHHLLKADLKDIEMAGNIGIPIFEYAFKPPKYLIVELSSFELEYCGHFKPNIMLFLNCYAHHLNHHQNFKAYLQAKMQPIKNMDQNDLLIVNQELETYFNSALLLPKVIFYAKSDVLKVKIPQNQFFNYDYNLDNFHGLIPILNFFKINQDHIFNRLCTFNPPTYRMETIYQTDQLIIINDSKSTCLKATIEAIKSLNKNYSSFNLTLIMGGKTDLDELIIFKPELKSLINNLQCYYYGENKDLLNQISPGIVRKTLEEVIEIIDVDSKKQVILFSPGAQSLDQFGSFIIRGNTFNTLMLKKIKHL